MKAAQAVGLLQVLSRAGLVACTPSGVIELLVRSGVAIAGAVALIVPRPTLRGTSGEEATIS